jgi:GDP-4-dehydro-6-deoxy-D-mannose reductase
MTTLRPNSERDGETSSLRPCRTSTIEAVNVVIRRAFVTGMNGFLGCHLAALLKARNLEIVAGLEDTSFDQQGRIDIRDGDRLRAVLERTRPDVVFHLAGLIKAAEPESFYDTNVLGTVTLLEAIRASSLRARVIFASSSAVYGEGGMAPITETRPVNPFTHYGASKAAAETVVKRFVSADALDAIVARMFNVVGPGQGETLAASEFARRVALRERNVGDTAALPVGGLDAVRDFVDVRDVARALVAIAEGGRFGATYNVCSGRGVPIRHCIDILISAARAPLRYAEINRDDVGSDVSMQIGDPGKIERELKWSPRICLKQSLTDLLEDWRLRTKELSNGLER